MTLGFAILSAFHAAASGLAGFWMDIINRLFDWYTFGTFGVNG